MVNLSSALVVLSISCLGAAHPGEHHDHEKVKREAEAHHVAQQHMARALEACSSSASFQALKQRSIERRTALAHTLRKKRDISSKPIYGKRDLAALETWMASNHNMTGTSDYTTNTPADILFSGNATCALTDETVLGPYYVTGELIRSDISEDQAGVPFYLDVQFVNYSDCSAIHNMVADIWHCNATGVYSGVTASGQAGLGSTFLRGAQISDEDGVAQFETIFPGHYAGRATHIHVVSTENATIRENATYTDGVATHVGQLFFDQGLISAVEASAPYTDNTAAITENVDDDIAQSASTADYDPFMDYALLGNTQSDGILAWITIGINTTANYSDIVVGAAEHYADYDVDTSDQIGEGQIGAAPSGGAPSGFSTGTDTATVSSTASSTESSASATSSTSTSSGRRACGHPLGFLHW
ncbi:hypothetical protein PFICI_12710 [Pestalotiopsis fici W106-1]|uniref:Intradiol ring-cleavage dioxygenases domain-containing protein n=1 Tax=Pestalotiopsis fici (strain W106-1 / CGMCC3.15140) TaxID=1229662 RepID=W3WSG4_PESFW|nr:uncharacterized protein PFICI_12710 [Pestalotiopsis fici W106-1]ETS75766.1 hypothetical protein PFICI_12710 [Pestalotiopsis fici W106-1]